MSNPNDRNDPPPPYCPEAAREVYLNLEQQSPQREIRDVYQARVDRDQTARLTTDLRQSKAQILTLKEEIEIWKGTVKALRNEVKGLKVELGQEKDSHRKFRIGVKEELKKDIREKLKRKQQQIQDYHEFLRELERG